MFLAEPAPAGGTPITPLAGTELDAWLRSTSPALSEWVRSTRFGAQAGEVCLIPGREGGLARVLLGRGEHPSLWDWAALPAALPQGLYRIDVPLTAAEGEAAALAWMLATYRFERYRSRQGSFPTLIPAEGTDLIRVQRLIEAIFLARDLINTPAEDLGPEQLAHVAADIGARFAARTTVLRGDDLLAHNYPAIHAVGRASSRPPCLVDLTWGDSDAPKLTLVGKGVCFDSGGLDIKPASAMKLMKKDMGGAAILLSLARLLMAEHAPVRLRLLIPSVENSISGAALRPLDVIRTRKGLTVEIGNTDAEGRVILADALTEATSEAPSLIIDCATLTGAARVALGAELPAVFANDDATVEALLTCGRQVEDPLWRLPLWPGYRRHVEGKIADLTNAPDHPLAGAITAALFLEAFVDKSRPWLHLDTMAWNLDTRPGRPEGGEASGLRALFAFVSERFER